MIRPAAFRLPMGLVPSRAPARALFSPAGGKKEATWLPRFRQRTAALESKVMETDVVVAKEILGDIRKLHELAKRLEPKGIVARKLRAFRRLSESLAKRTTLANRDETAKKIEALAPEFVPDRERPYRNHLQEAQKVLAEAAVVIQRAEGGDDWGYPHQSVEREIDILLKTWPHLE